MAETWHERLKRLVSAKDYAGALAMMRTQYPAENKPLGSAREPSEDRSVRDEHSLAAKSAAAPPPPVVDREAIAMFIMRWRLDEENGDWPEDKVRRCLDAITAEHYGDCTKAPITCLRCEAEVAYRQADDLLTLLTGRTGG